MNIFTQLIKSIYSPNDIARFRFQGIGKTILYVFILTLISIIPASYYSASTISEAAESVKETMKTDIPSFSIEQGELKSELKAPLTIKNESFTLIFDSTGTIEQKDLTGMDATFAILKNEAVLAAGGETNSFSYTLFGAETMTKQDIQRLINSASSSLPIWIGLLLIFIFVFSIGMKFIEVSILALFGLLLKNLAGRNLQYKQLWRMASYSVTLPTIFFAIMTLLKTTVPYSFAINWFVGSMILLLAIKEVPIPKKKND
ncbi:DUF1189 domain-containing protein [Mesobacillus subterraneus]|uniref:DUF1189 domain-containing protein n=1 Tax=Mesobacillus subterraneus TaxID=285983 RepID=UPI00203ECC20|nr:DUF1189 domain-containing protein [Mesobacillus subterraneus]MCM3663995.1 DUF1189 domain-containing protein [Mesobacillus subterraneus]MCM3683753.1 DUF1189 domain-containing protein [Mesobacillus subterraneus]